MTREQVLMGLGVLVLLSPWSGLPLAWLTWILLAVGLTVIGIGFTLWNRSRKSVPHAESPVQLQPEPESRSSHIAFS
jgi:Na+/H+ antiporter NhaC